MNDVSPSNPPKATSASDKKAPEPVAVSPGPIAQRLFDLGLAVTSVAPDATGKEAIELDPASALEVCRFLRDDATLQFDLLLSATGIDWKTHRETVYHLHSTIQNTWVVIKIKADEQDRSPSLMPVWHAADWHEREAYDLLGIVYDGHPDLRRILMPVYWSGFPLRKDYKEEDPRLVWNRR